jgi:hypothetical protein
MSSRVEKQLSNLNKELQMLYTEQAALEKKMMGLGLLTVD